MPWHVSWNGHYTANPLVNPPLDSLAQREPRQCQHRETFAPSPRHQRDGQNHTGNWKPQHWAYKKDTPNMCQLFYFGNKSVWLILWQKCVSLSGDLNGSIMFVDFEWWGKTKKKEKQSHSNSNGIDKFQLVLFIRIKIPRYAQSGGNRIVTIRHSSEPDTREFKQIPHHDFVSAITCSTSKIWTWMKHIHAYLTKKNINSSTNNKLIL